MSFPTIISGEGQDHLRTTDNTNVLPMGTKMVMSNGDVYRWCLVGGTGTVAARLYQSVVVASPYGTDENATVAAAAGATQVTVDVASAVTLDVLRQGVLIDETNSHSYEIKSNIVADPTIITLARADGLITDIATADTLRFYQSAYSNILLSQSPASALCVGFAQAVIATTEFGWLKTRGMTLVLVDTGTGALVVADTAQAAAAVSGAVGTEILTEQVVGIPYNIGTNAAVDGEIYAILDR